MSRSITPAPSGSLSPDFITVPSTTGFSAGDYVYQKNGDFGVPPAGVLANFNISPVSTVFGSTVGGTAAPVLYYSATSDAGGSLGACAAKLSNGNIVLGYRAQGINSVAFKIVDTNNVTVVAQTNLSVTALNVPCLIGVTALTGGGFVIHVINSSGKPGFGIYDNTGAVVTAFAFDTTYPTGASTLSPVSACALPNGGFAIAVPGNTLATTYIRAYGATGTPAYAWTAVAGNTGTPMGLGLAARSDSSVCIAFSTTSTNYIYTVYNSSGGSIATGNITVSNTPYQCSVACLTNDTFVIGISANGSTFIPRFYLLPTGNVLSSAFTVPTTNIPVGNGMGGNTWALQIKELSSGGFVYFLSDGNGAPYYVFYSAAGVAAYSIPKILTGPMFYNQPTVTAMEVTPVKS